LSGAARVLERCELLAQLSEEPGRLTRRFGTDAMRRANELVGGWMREAGLDVREDGIGNVIGRRGDGPVMMLGSHLDTVIDAGRYDGPLGVLVAIEVAERVPSALEVVGFADEEGVRFGTAYLGSSPLAGRFDPQWLERRDADGVRLGDLVRSVPGARDDVLGYVEVHIEQGPVLERLGEPVGAVTAIAGQSHAIVTFTGEAGHAGTVPMEDRHDALAAAAEWILAVERAGGTVGRAEVAPGVRNVIPGRTTMTLDLRGPDDAARREAVARLRDETRAIAGRRGVTVTWDDTGDAPAVAMDERLTAAFGVATRLPSGAGHDAAMMASIAPAAMLFVRCAGGISHNPAESVEEADVAVALDALERLLRAV
jgi:allantoate deiminase